MQIIPAGARVPIDSKHIVEVIDNGPGKDHYAIRRTWKEYRESVTGCIHIVGGVKRPGVLAFTSDLEHRHFWPPGSPLNEQFRLSRTSFGGLLYQVLSLPASYESLAARTADRCGLVLRKTTPIFRTEDVAVTHMSTSRYRSRVFEECTVFPLRGATVRTLEFKPGGVLAEAARAGLVGVVRNAEVLYADAASLSAARQHMDN